MDAGTWVALFIGIGSLGATVYVDWHNRDERNARVKTERWLSERQTAYAHFSGIIYAWFDEVHERMVPLMVGLSLDSTLLSARDSETWRRVLANKGTVELLAPPAVRDAARDAISAVTLFAAETRGNDPAAQHAERVNALAKLDVMTTAMRDDLGSVAGH